MRVEFKQCVLLRHFASLPGIPFFAVDAHASPSEAVQSINAVILSCDTIDLMQCASLDRRFEMKVMLQDAAYLGTDCDNVGC
jgi:hypothetical protein